MPKVTSEPCPYDGRIGSPSLFRDLYVVSLSQQRARDARDDGFLRGKDGRNPDVEEHRGWPTLNQATTRLNALRRDLSSGAVGTAFNPEDMPPVLADLFAPYNHAESVLPGVLGVQPLPPGYGMTLRIPVATSGAEADVQATQNSALADTDPVYDEMVTPIATVAGTLTGSQQLFDFATNPDVGIAMELGAALGAKVDQQILSGTGANGQTTGLLTASGTGSVAAASGSVEDVWQAIGEAYETIATQSGTVPDLALMHPRREAHLLLDTITNGRPMTLPGNLRFVGVPAIGTTSGAGTNEDRIILLSSSQSPLFLGDRRIEFRFGGTETGTLKWRLVAYQYLAMASERRPASVAVITGLTPPTW